MVRSLSKEIEMTIREKIQALEVRKARAESRLAELELSQEDPEEMWDLEQELDEVEFLIDLIRLGEGPVGEDV